VSRVQVPSSALNEKPPIPRTMRDHGHDASWLAAHSAQRLRNRRTSFWNRLRSTPRRRSSPVRRSASTERRIRAVRQSASACRRSSPLRRSAPDRRSARLLGSDTTGEYQPSAEPACRATCQGAAPLTRLDVRLAEPTRKRGARGRGSHETLPNQRPVPRLRPLPDDRDAVGFHGLVTLLTRAPIRPILAGPDGLGDFEASVEHSSR
jgi:hypothetical protein